MENSITKKRPELVAEWSDKNAPMTPEQVPYGSNKLYWWKGVCGHEWQTSAKARSSGEGCPICNNTRIIPGVNDLESLEPELAEEWSPKNNRSPSMVGVGSHKKVLWKGRCGHEWSAAIRSRVAGSGCPYCSHNIVLPGFNDLEIIFPDVAKEWSARNYPLLPSQVTPYSNRKVWWQCEHGHEWFTHISTRSYGSKCPYCSGIKLLKGFNDLATLYPELAKEWSDKNNTLAADEVNDRSTKNVWWRCNTCGHEYKAVVKSRVHGLMCPVCAERTVLPGYNDLATTDPAIAMEWDNESNGKRTPQTVSRNSMYPVWWKGKCGHRWKDKISNRTINQTGCIYCEAEFRRELPLMLVGLYAKGKGLKVRLNDENIIGVMLDAVVPELRLAFVFTYKGTDREKNILQVIRHLCKQRDITCVDIPLQDPAQMCIAIKQGFAKVHVYISSNNDADIAKLRTKFTNSKNGMRRP